MVFMIELLLKLGRMYFLSAYLAERRENIQSMQSCVLVEYAAKEPRYRFLLGHLTK